MGLPFDSARIMVYFRPIQSGSQAMESAPKAAPAENSALMAPRIESVYEAREPVSLRLKYL